MGYAFDKLASSVDILASKLRSLIFVASSSVCVLRSWVRVVS